MMVVEKLRKMLLEKAVSCSELCEKYIEATERYNKTLNAVIRTSFEEARCAASEVDRRLATGEALPPLAGIPMTLKDNICTKGIETTCCSKMLSGFRPIYDATVWKRLKDGGAVLLGKTNMDEFAMGSSCETSVFGPSSNPFDTERVPGGSSGGAAAAVSAGISVYALGSDTGGSVRQPASFCGTVGFKPSYGALSRYGLIAYASSFDEVGIITRTVGDCALVFDEISGPDGYDNTLFDTEKAGALSPVIKGRRIGISKELFADADDSVRQSVENAIKLYESIGAKIVEIELPPADETVAAYYILASAEASSNLGRYDGIRFGYKASGNFDSAHDMICASRSEGFGEEVKRRIMLGTFVLSSGYYDDYYMRAKNMQEKIKRAFSKAFGICDFIVSPTSPQTAFKKGFCFASPERRYLADVFTVSANIASLPAISLPCGFDPDGLPIGMQIMGRRFEDKSVLNAAYCFERATEGEYIRSSGMGAEL